MLQKRFMQVFLLVGTFAFFALSSCSTDDDPEPADDPVASFQFEISDDDPLTVIFTNFSQNAESYLWDFDDGNTSTEENPTYTYEEFGIYEVELTATNADGVSRSFSETIELQDPFEALALLAGEESKTWKLYRVDSSLGVGPDVDNPRDWWELFNDGERPCSYYHEFTFHRNGDYVFDDKGYIWGEGGVFHEDFENECIEAIPANMVGPDGEDLSPWLGGTHSYDFDPSTNMVTLEGLGAWIGLLKLGTNDEVSVPQNSVSFNIDIEERDGYDYMHVLFIYDWGVWSVSLAHYHDPALEPEVVEEQDEEEDLPPYAPEEFFNTFASTGEEDVQYLFPTEDESEVTITPGVDDPADPDGVKVGEYQRGTNLFADLKFMMDFNIQFDNFSTVSIDVYLPSDNDYSNGLDQSVQIWIADIHTTQNFWESWVQFVEPGDELPLDEWVTLTYDLAEPSEGSAGTPLERTDLDTVGLTIGGSNHDQDATFYIRNLIFE